MKIAVSAMIVLLAGSAGAGVAQCQQNPRQIEEIGEIKAHKIKSITTTTDINNISPPAHTNLTRNFDGKGNLVDSTGSNGNTGQRPFRWDYKYDDKGNEIEVASNGQKTTKSYKFDKAGRIVEVKSENPKTHFDENITDKYDDDGKLIDQLTRLSGNLVSESKFTYDPMGRVVEFIRLRPDGGLLLRTGYEYDTTGKIIQMLSFNSSDQPSGKTVYTYDSDGRLAEDTGYAADATARGHVTYKRDANGLVIEETSVDAQGKVLRAAKSSYEFY